MAKVKDYCSLEDTTILRNLILENPELPLIIFCGEEAWDGECAYTSVDASSGEIEELTLFYGQWVRKDDCEEVMAESLADEEEYKDMSDEEYQEMVKEKVNQIEFVKAICIYVG